MQAPCSRHDTIETSLSLSEKHRADMMKPDAYKFSSIPVNRCGPLVDVQLTRWQQIDDETGAIITLTPTEIRSHCYSTSQAQSITPAFEKQEKLQAAHERACIMHCWWIDAKFLTVNMDNVRFIPRDSFIYDQDHPDFIKAYGQFSANGLVDPKSIPTLPPRHVPLCGTPAPYPRGSHEERKTAGLDTGGISDRNISQEEKRDSGSVELSGTRERAPSPVRLGPIPTICASKTKSKTKITVGTDCSGIEVPMMALENLKVPHTHLFSSESDSKVRKTLKANFSPMEIHPDITQRRVASMPEVDLYLAGFPCQPFSTAGKQQGFNDESGRGTIFFHVHEYIEIKHPKVFVLENVKGIKSIQNGKYVKSIIRMLKSILDKNGKPLYKIHHTILNTKDHGLPQNRPRWYCVGVRTDVSKETAGFEFPSSIPCPHIDEILDGVGQTRSSHPAQLSDLSETARQNVQRAYARINIGEKQSQASPGSRDTSTDQHQSTYIIDCDASKQRSSFMKGISPCITRSRGNGHWISSRGRRLNPKEMMRLQGIDPNTFKVPVSDSEVGKQLGNAMSVNVVERLLQQLLGATTLLPNYEPGSCRWKSGEALKRLQTSIDASLTQARPIALMSNKAMSAGKIREFLMDSGASLHLVGMKDLTEEEIAQIRDAEIPVNLETANSEVYTDKVIDLWVHCLQAKLEFYVLPDSSTVVSLGKVVEDHDFTFIWRKGHQPFIRNGRIKITCPVQQNCPSIVTAVQTHVAGQACPGYHSDIESRLKRDSGSDAAPPGSEMSFSDQRRLLDVDETFQYRKKKSQNDDAEQAREAPQVVLAGSSDSQASKPQVSGNEPVRGEQADAVPPPPPSLPTRRKKSKSKRVTKPTGHNLYTHFPRCPNCKICQEFKPIRDGCRSKQSERLDGIPIPARFGEQVRGDHKNLNAKQQGASGERNCFIMKDRHTSWLQSYATKTKDANETYMSMNRFTGTNNRIEHFFSDSSQEIKKACEMKGALHDTGQPYRSETNGISERSVQKVKQGTSCTLGQSGWSEPWWPYAMMYFCFIANVLDVLMDGQTPYEKRFGCKFGGPIIPFGAEILYHPISPQDQSRTHQMASKMLRGIFMGYKQYENGGGWSNLLYVADWDEVHKASRTDQIYLRQMKPGEVIPNKKFDEFYFPLKAGDLDQPLISPAERQIRRERSRRPKSKPHSDDEGPLPLVDSDSETDVAFQSDFESEYAESTDVEARDSGSDVEPKEDLPTKEEDFWTFQGETLTRHHRQPRDTMFDPRKSPCPVPLKFLDVMRHTNTDCDLLRDRNIEDYWTNSDNNKRHFDQFWTGSTRFELIRPEPPEGKRWVQGRLTRKQKSRRPDTIWPEFWVLLSKKDKKKAIQEWAEEKPRRDKERHDHSKPEFVTADLMEEYDKSIAYAKTNHPGLPAAPAMVTRSPTLAQLAHLAQNEQKQNKKLGQSQQSQGSTRLPSSSSAMAMSAHESDQESADPNEEAEWRRHQDHLADKGVSEAFYAMVHKQIPTKIAISHKEARPSMDKEWEKLESKNFVDYSKSWKNGNVNKMP